MKILWEKLEKHAKKWESIPADSIISAKYPTFVWMLLVYDLNRRVTELEEK